MNNKAQSVITIAFWVIVFIIGFAVFFGGWINTIGEDAISSGQVTGFEAFVYGNLNVFIIIALIIFILAYLYMGGGG